MGKIAILLLAAVQTIISSCSQKVPENFVLIKGGAFKNSKSAYYGKGVKIPGFIMGVYEVTQKEWMEVMGSNPSEFKGDDLPVESVSWYDCVEYCNKKSVREGLKPYYKIDIKKKDRSNTSTLDTIKWEVVIDIDSDGYRLPMQTEWEYASGGGQESKDYTYSGSDNIDEVAWYWKNSGDKYLTGSWSWSVLEHNRNSIKPVGGKKPNELGLHDMSGNVREWCWDWQEGNGTDSPQGRIWRGGGWIGADFCCTNTFAAGYQANGKGPDQGFRICRSI